MSYSDWRYTQVLILVILDVPLRPIPPKPEIIWVRSLNPCYTGCASSALNFGSYINKQQWS